MTNSILAAPTLPCLYCAETLTFRRKTASEDHGPGQGDTSPAWRHPDGSIYKQRDEACRPCEGIGLRFGRLSLRATLLQEDCTPCGGTGRVRIDDHCATPDLQKFMASTKRTE